MATENKIVFVSMMNSGPWGGSEELWAGAALHLAGDGLRIAASVHGWLPPHPKIQRLVQAGINVQFRRAAIPLHLRVWHKVTPRNGSAALRDLAAFITAEQPALVVICIGAAAPPIDLLQLMVFNNWPFATIAQANSEQFWPDDAEAAEYRRLMPAARKCYFVSRANLELFQDQIGMDLTNGEVVCNPFNVRFDADVPWPPVEATEELRLASVARLHPPSKGQDILIEALADSSWRGRNWQLTFYGDGPMREGINRLISRAGLDDHIRVAGFSESIENIWAQNHVLMMPSRYEGMPLSMVEAMLCSRPVVATDVAGHSEILHDGINGFMADAPTVNSLRAALERLWAAREKLKMMGTASAHLIRKFVPAEPTRSFADKIKAIAADA